MRIHAPLIYMNILIYGYGYLTSSIRSIYPSEQIRTPSPPARCRVRSICIPRVGSSKADPTNKHSSLLH